MAKWLGFIDNSGAERPLSGRRSVEDVVSHVPGVRKALADKAYKGASYADLLLDIRPRHRTGASQIDVQAGDLDYYIVLSDRTPGKSRGWRKGAAYGIEEHHQILRDTVNRLGGK